MNASTDTRRKVEASLGRRHRRERLLRFSGLGATLVGIVFLGIFFATVIAKGWPAFQQTHLALDVEFSEEALATDGEYDPANADFDSLVRDSLREVFPGVRDRRERRELFRLASVGAAYRLRELVAADPDLVGSERRVWVPASADVDMVLKGRISRDLDQSERPVSDRQLAWIDELREAGRLELRFNKALFTNGDSREPELAGIKGALAGSFYMLIVTIALSFPLGAAAAVYLEEFAPKNRWSDLIEVNINNLAAVPSIVFGLLGLAVFINWMGLPRSAPLVGGLVLALMTLPVIIIASRAAIKAVPPSLRRELLRAIDRLIEVAGDLIEVTIGQPALEPPVIDLGDQGRSAVDPGGGPRGRCLAHAGRRASRPAARATRNAHRRDHRHESRAGRNRPAPDDRHGGIHRRRAGRLHRSRDGAAGADLPLGGQPGARVCRAHVGRDHRAPRISAGNEPDGSYHAEARGAALVAMVSGIAVIGWTR